MSWQRVSVVALPDPLYFRTIGAVDQTGAGNNYGAYAASGYPGYYGAYASGDYPGYYGGYANRSYVTGRPTLFPRYYGGSW